MRGWLVLLALGACADPVIDMSLEMPATSEVPAGFDLSCVTAVDVYVDGTDQGTIDQAPDRRPDCVDLPHAPRSFSDLRSMLAGQVDLKFPESGFAGVEVRGTPGACKDSYRDYEANVYGAAPYTGGDSLAIPVVPNISCSAKQSYTASVVDILALVRTKQCATAELPYPTVNSGDFRPRMLGTEFADATYERGPSYVSGDAAGTARDIASWSGAGAHACIALAALSNSVTTASCINPSAPTLCAGPNQLEVPAIDDNTSLASEDSALLKKYGKPVYGAVFRQSPAATTMKEAIQGATVELEDPSQGTVVYASLGTNEVTAIPNATSTGPDGLFVIYLKGRATNVIVKSGASQQRYTVASAREVATALLAVLP